MERIKVAPDYLEKYLEVDRPQPLTDSKMEKLIQELLPHRWGYTVTNELYSIFKSEMQDWLLNSQLNTIIGLETFNRIDIINGCTQFIDSIYMKGQPQVLIGDYRYHDRLGNWGTQPGLLKENTPLIIAMPFPTTGAVHSQMSEILDECLEKEIPVHIDGAWLTCCRDIVFDVSHPAIHSVGISLSKGLGLGWNRIGLRWTRNTIADSVTIMNDFNMNLRGTVMIGLHFLRNLDPDYLWNTYEDIYYKICKDFNLEPTNSIYLAIRNGQPVGVSPLIKHVAEQ
jgi:hypothetical protein